MTRHTILVFFGFLSVMIAYAQETMPRASKYDIEYYMMNSPTVAELKTMQSVVFERVSTLQKKNNRSREENLALLKDAQFFCNLYHTIQNKDVKASNVATLIAVRDEFISYIAKNKHDYEIKTELAFLVNMAFVYGDTKDSYQSVRLIQEVGADVYNNAPNAKVALMLGQSYISASTVGMPLMVTTLAERYLNKALKLDKGDSYLSYLTYISFANLYFKTRKMDKAREYMDKAKTMYPDGAFAYIVEEFFFAYGKTLL